jgi:hypothetical protein
VNSSSKPSSDFVESLARRATVRADSGFYERKSRGLLEPTVGVAVAVLVGVILRLVLYAANRSLTLDESFVALNVARRSARGLFGQLYWNSAAPVGFLELEKLVTSLLGDSEFVLRAPAFVASIASLFIFALLARRVVSWPASGLAVVVFAGLAFPLSYAAIAKPYALDVLAATVLWLATLNLFAHPGNLRWIITLGVTGVLAPVFSYASVFNVAASAAVLLGVSFGREVSKRARVGFLSLVGVWAVLLVLAYLWHHSSFARLQRTFGSGHLGSAQSFRDVLGAVRIVLGVSPEGTHVGRVVTGIAAVAAAFFLVYGVVALARRAWHVAALVALPGLFAAISSAASLYPLVPRTMLFLVPGLALAMAAGVEAFASGWHRAIRWAAAAGLLLTIAVSEVSAIAGVFRPAYPDAGMKSVLSKLATERGHNTTMYFGYAAQYPLAFYLTCDCADTIARRALADQARDVVEVDGTDEQWSPALASRSPRLVFGAFRVYGTDGYYRDLAGLRGHGRVWVVLSFLSEGERRHLLNRLDRLGVRTDSVRKGSGTDAVSAYLYDFGSQDGGG